MKTLENRISSREVAEMMGKQHKHILEKIDKLNEDLISLNLGQSKYWVESSFVDDKNRTYREYKITELGCELIAHKTIGKDGTAFTVKYMDRFHKMKEIIEENSLCTCRVCTKEEDIDKGEMCEVVKAKAK